MRERVPLPARCQTRLVYDYGIDEQLVDHDLVMDERGMRFNSRWEFSLGTQLALNCIYEHPRLGVQQVRLTGLVVWSERLERIDRPALFDTTILFLEVPEHLRESLRDIPIG